MPVGSLRRRGAIHATSGNDVHVSCQSRRFFSRKTKNLFSRPETSFLLRAASVLATLEVRGGWSESPQWVERIAPVGGANSPTTYGGVNRFAPLATPYGRPSATHSASSALPFFENPAEIRGDGSRGFPKDGCPSSTPPPDFHFRPRLRRAEPCGFAQARSQRLRPPL